MGTREFGNVCFILEFLNFVYNNIVAVAAQRINAIIIAFHRDVIYMSSYIDFRLVQMLQEASIKAFIFLSFLRFGSRVGKERSYRAFSFY